MDENYSGWDWVSTDRLTDCASRRSEKSLSGVFLIVDPLTKAKEMLKSDLMHSSSQLVATDPL